MKTWNPRSHSILEWLKTRLILTQDGDVLAPDGYDLDLTREVRRVLASKRAKDKYVRWLRAFFRFELEPGEDTYAFLTESFEQAVRRCKAFLQSLGLVVEVNDNHLDAGFTVSHPTSMAYLRTAVTVLRQLYTRLCGGLREDLANPMNVTGWHLMNAAERLSWALTHQIGKKHTLKHAGGRFQIVGVTSSPPAIEDPSRCGPEMTQALVTTSAPDSILDIGMVMEANGCRIGGPLIGNALGWSMAGFNDEFWATKKRGGDDLCLLLLMPAEVHARLVERMEKTPHPRRKGRSLLDYVKELAAQGTERAKAKLARIPLFPSSRGKAYSYSGFYYWFTKAVEGRVFIRTSNSSRTPTSQWYRHAAISDDVRVLFASTTVKAEREAGLEEILQDYGLSTDQTQQYAAFEYLRDARRRQREKVKKRRERSAAKRAGASLPVQTQRLTTPGAQQAFDLLPVRSKL